VLDFHSIVREKENLQFNLGCISTWIGYTKSKYKKDTQKIKWLPTGNETIGGGGEVSSRNFL
jgi:hypothetical protein